MIDFSRLSDYFDPKDLEWRVGSTNRDKTKGMALVYVTSRAIQNRLDEVFGPGGWKNEFREGPDGGVICRIHFKTGATLASGDPEWAWREDGAENTQVEAVKGGLSSAMKRAGSALGIGRYLYEFPPQWVDLGERGRMTKEPRVPREFLPGNEPHRRGQSAPRPAPQQAAPQQAAPQQPAPQQGETPAQRLYKERAQSEGMTPDEFLDLLNEHGFDLVKVESALDGKYGERA